MGCYSARSTVVGRFKCYSARSTNKLIVNVIIIIIINIIIIIIIIKGKTFSIK